MAKHNTPPPKARNVDFEETDSAAHWGQTPRFLHRKKIKENILHGVFFVIISKILLGFGYSHSF